jgi:Deacetylases, including yeast histone deacetylase and acetoin utilization protein
MDHNDGSYTKNGFNFLDGDRVVFCGSKEEIMDVVGSIIAEIDGVEEKEFKNVFCVVRTPGHYAEKEKVMGFCIYNNVAVGDNYLIEKYGYKKIAIIDFEVYHGNGT